MIAWALNIWIIIITNKESKVCIKSSLQWSVGFGAKSKMPLK